MANKDFIYDEDDTINIQIKLKTLSTEYNQEVIPDMQRAVNVMNLLSNTQSLSKFSFQNIAKNLEEKTDDFYDMLIGADKALGKAIDALSKGTTVSSDFFDNLDGLGPGCASGSGGTSNWRSVVDSSVQDAISATIRGGIISTAIINGASSTVNGAMSVINKPSNTNTGTRTGGTSTTYIPSSSSSSSSSQSSSSSSASDKSGPQHNGVIKIDEEEKEKFEEFKEKFKDQEEKLRKEQEEVEKQQKEIKNQQEALKKQQEEIKKQQDEVKKQQDEIAKKQEELAKKDEELKKREEELNNREQQNNNTPANEPTTPNDSNNGNNNTPSDNNNYNNNNNNSAHQNTVYRQENTTPVANNSTAPAETGTVDTPTTTPTTPEKVENTTPSTKGDSGSLGTGNDLFGDDPEPTTTPTTLPDADTTTKSSKSGFNPIPIAVGLGAAVAGGVGVKAYKNHKQNSEFDDANEDSFTNGNRFWTDDEPNVVNSEQNELSGDALFNEQTTSPSYSAVTNQANNNDTWSVQDTNTSGDDSRTYDLLGEN